MRAERIGGGVSLITAPLAFFVGTIVHPGLRDDPRAQLELIARHPDAWYATHVLGLIFVIVMVPAVVFLVTWARRHEPLLAYVGGAVAMVGLVAWGGVVAIFGWVWGEAARGDRDEMATLVERVAEVPRAVIPTRALSFGLAAGLLLFAVAFVRAGVRPRWAAPLAAAGMAIFAVGGLSSEKSLLVAGTAALAVGLGSLGIQVLRRVDTSPSAARQRAVEDPSAS